MELEPGAWANLGTCGTTRESVASVARIPAEISINPNPVIGADLFTTARGKNVNYTIYNLSEQTVAKGTVNESVINVANLKANVYLIQINDGEQKVTKKFIKK